MNLMRKKLVLLCLLATVVLKLVTAGDKYEPYAKKDVYFKALTPEKALKTIEVPRGFKLQVVASEPMVQEPASFVFDADGAMYVCEWLTYMQDEEGTGQKDKTCRIVKLVDRDGDGVMDHRTVFIDKIPLPRNVLPLEDRVLVTLTGSYSVFSYFDDDKDGVSDRFEETYKGASHRGNIEHQVSGLIWNLDNYIYSNYHRFKYKDGKLLAERHSKARISQWGMARDDMGRIYCSWAGGANPVCSYHLPGGYGYIDFARRETWTSDYAKPYTICNVDDQSSGGYDFENDRILTKFTATCGQTVLRSPLYPDFYGYVATCEPVGRFIRLTRMEWKKGKGLLYNAFPKSEFIRSSDPFFRPVWTEMGPDGCFYFSDMYRGIIQEKTWFPTKGNHKWVKRYHRVKEWGMLKVFRHGRIYRLVPKNKKIKKAPELSKMNTVELCAMLDSENGWLRDNAQKLLVLRGNKKVEKELLKIAKKSRIEAGRVAAMWTLHGLGLLTTDLISQSLRDRSPFIRRAAVQFAEPFLGKEKKIDENILQLMSERDPFVVMQLYLAMERAEDHPVYVANKEKLALNNEDLPVLKLYRGTKKKNEPKISKALLAGKKVYESLCSNCHGENGRGVMEEKKLLAPALAKSRWFKNNGNINVIAGIMLKGASGPLGGQSYGDGIMMPLEKVYNDKQLANVINYIGKTWNGWKKTVSHKEIGKIRKKLKYRKTPWTDSEINQLQKNLVVKSN